MDFAASSERFDIIPYADLSPEPTWRRIGNGAFGAVWQGQYLGIAVAIKEIADSVEYDTDKYLRRECVILQEARHPNIVAYLGVCLAPPPPARPDGEIQSRDKRILIVSEYLSGGNLRSVLLGSEPLPWRARISFAIDLARAVAYLHARNCLHRDIKAENALLTDNGRVKICDFGFARMAPRNEVELRRMSYCGTDSYMSPEILQEEDFNLPTDIFSLGCIFAELISRQLASDVVFARAAPIFAVDGEEIASRASLGCPPALIALTQACCATLQDLRPTAVQVLDKLMGIEQQVIADEQKLTPGPVPQVGSFRFTNTISSRVGTRRAPRMPSFEGQVVMTTRGVKDSLIGLGHPPRPGGRLFNMPNRDIHNTEIADTGDESESPVAAPSTLADSRVTVRAEAGTSHFSVRSSRIVPSLPASWLQQADTEPPLGREENGTSSSSSGPSTESDTPSIGEKTSIVAIRSFRTSITSEQHANGSSISMHRFTLLKAGWIKLFFRTNKDTPAAKCRLCDKKLGVLREYMRCDDCALVAHTHCADNIICACPGDGVVGSSSGSIHPLSGPLVTKTQIRLRQKQ